MKAPPDAGPPCCCSQCAESRQAAGGGAPLLNGLTPDVQEIEGAPRTPQDPNPGAISSQPRFRAFCEGSRRSCLASAVCLPFRM